MFFLCLTLLSAAAFLQSSVSAVLLKCSETVEVVAEETVTLTCSIHYQDVAVGGCKVIRESAAAVITDCGLPLSSPINVQVKHFHGDKIESELNLERDTKISAILCICVVVIVAGILYFLLGTDRGRKIIKHFTREKIQRDNSDTDSEISKDSETSTMFFLCLTLLSAAAFLQSSVSAVLLKCSETVEVVAEETVTLTCSIHYQDVAVGGCKVISFTWNNTNVSIPCDSGSGEYICDSDNQTYVSLIISNVMKEENYTAAVITDCGLALSSTINVQVKHFHGGPEPEKVTNVAAISGICVAVIVAAILFFLFGTDRGRKLIKHNTRETNHTAYSDPESKTNSLHQPV
ncbi:uncharacterized protein AKAME5_002952900 [Lates japonicus]|uniref:Immunoglobulin domain-containing protein n=1 Tax=Lates japonicus TaxID=270547 RepID=A0AAD3M3T9_LATJO|nr:uncharacterized protein AKAME5_002952900 [Lates japonicus]